MLRICGACTAALVAAALLTPALTAARMGDARPLAAAVPGDVFLYISEKDNPKREFLDDYWDEVVGALCQSGIGDDLMGLLGMALGEGGNEEVARLKERATELIEGVDWDALNSREMVFAERFDPLSLPFDDNVRVVTASMVWILRGEADGPARNYDGLVNILDAIAAEINRATGSEALTVKKSEEQGARVARLNLLAMIPGATPLTLAVAHHQDLIIIGFRQDLFEDSLALALGRGTDSLAGNERFRNAFNDLPPGEDMMLYFDIQAMLKPLRAVFGMMVNEMAAGKDIYHNSRITGHAATLNNQALSAYRTGDTATALKLVREAYDSGSRSSIVLYNLACFSALEGQTDAALDWLDKAIEGGFYAPGKISEDSDLKSLHDLERFRTALDRARELARIYSAEDVVVNSTRTGEAYRQTRMAYQACDDNKYQEAYENAERACSMAPDDPRSHYCLASCHALLGHRDSALAELQKSVELGFYCPQHIAKDGEFETLREDERFKKILATARDKAQAEHHRKANAKTRIAEVLLERVTGAIGIMDYVAVVQSTRGYSTHTESMAMLMPDADSRPFYPVIANGRQLTDFDRYLPKETRSFSVSGGVDVAALYTFLLDTLREAGPAGEELLDRWAAVQKQHDFDVERDVISWVGESFTRVTLEDRSTVFLMEVKDEATARDKVASAIDFFNKKLKEAAQQIPALAMLSIRTGPINHPDLEGFQGVFLSMSPQPMVWGVEDHRLIIGTSADSAALCLKTARGEHPGLDENERAMAEALVPQGGFSAVSLTDQRRLGNDLAAGVSTASMMTAMASSFIPDPTFQPILGKISTMLAKLGPVLTRIDFYKSTALLTTFDGKRWHSRTVTHYKSPEERRQ